MEGIRYKELDFNPDATHVLNNWTATRQLIEVAIIVPINGVLPVRLYYLWVDRGLQGDF